MKTSTVNDWTGVGDAALVYNVLAATAESRTKRRRRSCGGSWTDSAGSSTAVLEFVPWEAYSR